MPTVVQASERNGIVNMGIRKGLHFLAISQLSGHLTDHEQMSHPPGLPLAKAGDRK